MTNEERKNKYMNRNIKLLPGYIALTWDILFAWTISTMFFTQQKGMTYSQAILLDSVLMLAAAVFVILVPKMFAKIPTLKSTQIGLLGYAAYTLLCIFGQHYFVFIIATIFLAFGYSVQAIKINILTSESLSKVKRDKDYQRITGSGLSLFNILEAVGAILIVYVYNWQPYMAYWISFGVVIITLLYSLLLTEPNKFPDSNIKLDPKEDQDINNSAKEKNTDKKDKSDNYFKLLSSGFMIAMLLYAFFFRGAIAPYGSSFRLYLQIQIDGGVLPVWAFGYIYAGLKVCASISSKYQFKFNLKFGVRSLLIFNISLILGFFINGIVYLIAPNSIWAIVVVTISSYVLASLRLPHQIFINNYIQVCSHKKNHERIYALKTMMEYLSFSLMNFLYAGLLGAFNDNYGLTEVVYMGILAIPIIVSLVVFIKLLCKKHAERFTIIKKEYTED